MARVKSEFVSSFKIAGSVFEKIANAVIDAGGNDEHLRRLETDDTLRAKVAAIIVGTVNTATQTVIDTYHLAVDYGQTLQQMIANGKYDYTNIDITSGNFPITGNGNQDAVVELFHFGRDMTTDDVLKDLESKGMRPAILPELLAFGSTYPEKQREFPIIALGSVWRYHYGDRIVPYLGKEGSRRRLDLDWGGRGWNDYCRFAAVRK